MTRDFVFEALHGKFDPYAGIVSPLVGDVRGWNDAGEFFELLKGLGVESYLEVGSWCGASMLRAMRVFEPAWAIAVDTWLGAAEHWLDERNPTHDLRRGPDGQPGIYEEFRRNMVGYQVADRVCPLRLPSSVAAPVLAGKGIQADVVYIDGAHDRASVELDCQLYAPLARKVICGDDWGDRRFGVADGVVDWMRSAGIGMGSLEVFRGNWWVVRLG